MVRFRLKRGPFAPIIGSGIEGRCRFPTGHRAPGIVAGAGLASRALSLRRGLRHRGRTGVVEIVRDGAAGSSVL